MNPWHPAAAGGLSRRELLAKGTLGVGTLALASLLERDRLLAEPLPPDLAKRKFDLSPKPAHHAPRARAMISLYMQGGPSHVDLFDPKPLLTQLDGKQFPGEIQYDNAAQASSKVLGSPWKFKRHGQSGAALSELLPHLAEIVDDLAIVRSMRTGVNNHGQSIDALNGGRPVSGRPALGSWLTYGLGAENQNLPAFVVLVDQAAPVLGSKNWANGWLPSLYQGTVIRQREPRILNLDPPPEIRGAVQERTLGLLGQMNRRHLEERPGELDPTVLSQCSTIFAMRLAYVTSLDFSARFRWIVQPTGSVSFTFTSAPARTESIASRRYRFRTRSSALWSSMCPR